MQCVRRKNDHSGGIRAMTHSRTGSRNRLVGWLSTAVLTLLWPVAAIAQAMPKADFDIPPQRLETALQQVAQVQRVQILFSENDVKGLETPGVKGKLSTYEAVQKLIEGTGLSAVANQNNAIAIKPKSANEKGGQAANPTVLAQAQSAERPGQPQLGPSGEKAVQLEGIVVTAQKREEFLIDVPVPVTVLDARALVTSNQLRLRDYYSNVPGLTLAPRPQSQQVLTLRGLSTGPGNPTVGVVVDGLPFGASTNLGGGSSVPDFDPGDLARVEVLRGPQGTLFGASSISGLLNFVTVDPSTAAFSGRAQAGIQDVHNGHGLGFNARGSINVPISDTVAVRASGFTRRDAGYIDNPALAIRGINRSDASGGRLSALWQASDRLSIKLGAFVQQIDGDGASDVFVQPGFGDLEQGFVRGAGVYERRVQAYNATLMARLADVHLTSLTGYSVNEFSDSSDFTSAFATLTQRQFGVTGTPLRYHNKTSKVSQELRLESAVGQKVDWLLGGFYTDEDSPYSTDILASNPTTGEIVGQWAHLKFPSKFKEYAAFADVTFRPTDRLEVQVGGRQSQIRQTTSEAVTTGPYTTVFLGLPSPVITPEQNARFNAFTYLLTPRYKFGQDAMAYLRLASGYRAGGTNGTIPGVPVGYKPDKTFDYEVGVKGAFLDNRLSIDASIYRIDWKDIQIGVVDPVSRLGYTANAAEARSQGVELAAQFRPADGLAIAGWIAWSDAELTEDFPSTSQTRGFSGDRLPFSSRFSWNLSIEQRFRVFANARGFLGATVAHVGDRLGVFRGPAMSAAAPSLPRQTYPGYYKVDLKAGVIHGPYTVTVFVNNLSDKRGVLSGGLGFTPAFAFTYIDPRTVGVNVVMTF
jgi:iron complex outermembrane recepter protein